MRRPRPVPTVLVVTSILFAAHDRTLILVLASIFALLYFGLVLPAVWLADAQRRRDARAVLQQLFDLIHHLRSP